MTQYFDAANAYKGLAELPALAGMDDEKAQKSRRLLDEMMENAILGDANSCAGAGPCELCGVDHGHPEPALSVNDHVWIPYDDGVTGTIEKTGRKECLVRLDRHHPLYMHERVYAENSCVVVINSALFLHGSVSREKLDEYLAERSSGRKVDVNDGHPEEPACAQCGALPGAFHSPACDEKFLFGYQRKAEGGPSNDELRARGWGVLENPPNIRQSLLEAAKKINEATNGMMPREGLKKIADAIAQALTDNDPEDHEHDIGGEGKIAFAVADPVRLKAGGQLMSVESIDNGKVCCKWTKGSGLVVRETYDLEDLEHAEDGP